MNPPTGPTAVVLCAAPGCDHPVTRTSRPGRPPIYCSPACRPSRDHRGTDRLVVEVDHEPAPTGTRPTGRIWIVRLRRSAHTVVIATELGRPSADHLANQINALLDSHPPPSGAAID